MFNVWLERILELLKNNKMVNTVQKAAWLKK